MCSFTRIRTSVDMHEGAGSPLEYRLGIEHVQVLDQFCHESGPTRLVAGTETRTIVAMEILLEEEVVAPVRIALECVGATVDRPPALVVPQIDSGEAPGNLHGHLKKVHHP